jgi:hypothetical protein
MDRSQRDAEIYALHKEGKSHPEIAALFNLTYQRISQICLREAEAEEWQAKRATLEAVWASQRDDK